MILTFLARVLDGLILAETWEQQGADQFVNQLKQTAKQLLKKVANGPTRMSVELKTPFQFHYIIEDGVCFLTVCEKNYSKKLAFSFLEEIHRAFIDELRKEFGQQPGKNYQSHIETVDKPYYFIKFDRVIQAKKAEYLDPKSSKLSKLNDGLTEVSNIMKKNIDEMMASGERIESVGLKGQMLVEKSALFAKNSRMLSLQALAKKYGLVAVVVFITCFVVYVKLF